MNINIGVIGIGIMGEYHTRVYNEILKRDQDMDIHLVGVADIDKKRVEAIARKYGISRTFRTYTDYNTLLENHLNAVSICVPTSMHYKVATEAMQKGVRHLLIEKPISDNLNNANEIVKLARGMGVTLSIGHVERFNPAVLEMKKIIESGRLGKVVSISAKRVGPGPPRFKDTGVIVDLAVHDLDVICWLYGACATDVYAIAGGGNGLEDRASIILKFDGNRAGLLETNWLTSNRVRTLDIVGLKAVAHLDYINQTIVISTHERDEEIKFIKQEPLMKELTHFINIVRGKDVPLVTGEDGISALRLAIAAGESYKTGDVIRL